jgi:putative peptide zinc metalloprotease protein
MRRITALLATTLAICLGAGGLAAAPAAAQGDNAAVATNTKDGTSIFKFAFSIKRVTDDVVDNGNAAVAYSSCDSCQAVALAIQIVLVSSDPSVVSPENLAIAINENCNLCETLAAAYQFVFGGGDTRLQFTPEGLRRLAELRKAFRDLGKEDLGVEEIASRLDGLVAELRDVVHTELIELPGGGPPDSGAEPSAEAAPSDTTDTTPTDTTGTSTEPPPPPPESTSTEPGTTTETTPTGTETTPTTTDTTPTGTTP